MDAGRTAPAQTAHETATHERTALGRGRVAAALALGFASPAVAAAAQFSRFGGASDVLVAVLSVAAWSAAIAIAWPSWQLALAAGVGPWLVAVAVRHLLVGPACASGLTVASMLATGAAVATLVGLVAGGAVAVAWPSPRLLVLPLVLALLLGAAATNASTARLGPPWLRIGSPYLDRGAARALCGAGFSLES